MDHTIADHEAVRDFVQQKTGGFVEKIESNSTSYYKPTLDSLEEVKATSPDELYRERFFMQHRIKPNPTYLPTHYTVDYTVTVVFPPGDNFLECRVCWSGDKYMIVMQRAGIRMMGVE